MRDDNWLFYAMREVGEILDERKEWRKQWVYSWAVAVVLFIPLIVFLFWIAHILSVLIYGN